MIQRAEQSKCNFCIAVYNRYLHSKSICPGNHEVDYDRGWFYFDGKAFHDPKVREQAEEIMRERSHSVYYQPVWNTFVLADYFEE